MPLNVVEWASTVFPGASLVIMGCAADGTRREYCEVNLGAFPATGSVRQTTHGGLLYQLIPLADPLEIVRGPREVVRDDNWNVSTVLASGRAMKLQALHRYVVSERETESLRFLVLSYAALDRERTELASAYMLSALSKLSETVILDRGIPVHPSHLAEDLRKAGEMAFYASITEFDMPSLSNCRRRIQKVIGAFGREEGLVLKRKLEGLMNQKRLFDCLYYSYWCIAKKMEEDEASALAFARELGVGLPAQELKGKLAEVTDVLKSKVRKG